MKLSIIYCLFSFTLVATGCSKFTDVTPKGRVLPKTVADYEGFLNDIIMADAGYIYSEFMSDDLMLTDATATSQAGARMGRAYFWDKELIKATEDDAEWNTPYNRIYYCNLVLDNIDAVTDSTTRAFSNRVKAEAVIHRAYYLLNLVNLYGKDYREATAATDAGIPIMQKADLEATASRASVKAVYETVISQLTAVLNVPELPDFGRNYVHPGKAGVKAILARAYFLKGEFAKAAEYADAALAMNSALVDYNTWVINNPANPFSGGIKNKPVPELNPENLYARTNSSSGIFIRFMINPNLHTVLGEKDLRFVFNFTHITQGGGSPNPYPNYFGGAPNFSIGVPEMMLIKAEYLAREGQSNDAMTILNTLRSKRFTPADYTELTAANPEEALVKVLEERRRELFYHGLRWFDLKRLNNDDRFKKTLTRSHNGRTETLAPGSPRYLLQIAPKIIGLNPNITPNER